MNQVTRRALLAAISAAGVSTLMGDDDEMSQSKFGPDAFGQGDVMRRLRLIEREITQLRTARSLQAASIGQGGLTVRGGVIRVQDIDGDDMFRAGGDPGEVFIRDDILGPLVRQIFGAGIRTTPTITTPSPETTSSSTFTNLATPGPTVAGVEVSSAGRALVILGGALIANGGVGPVMSFDISGATDRPADDFGGVLALFNGGSDPLAWTGSAVVTVDGLNPGVHTFTARYRSDSGSAAFNQRALSVIPF